jgi:tryptophan synthase alpha chain
VTEVSEKVRDLKTIAKIPLFVGFGIKNGETAAAVGSVADGVVVGSAIVDIMARHETDRGLLEKSVVELTGEIRSALDAISA